MTTSVKSIRKAISSFNKKHTIPGIYKMNRAALVRTLNTHIPDADATKLNVKQLRAQLRAYRDNQIVKGAYTMGKSKLLEVFSKIENKQAAPKSTPKDMPKSTKKAPKKAAPVAVPKPTPTPAEDPNLPPKGTDTRKIIDLFEIYGVKPNLSSKAYKYGTVKALHDMREAISSGRASNFEEWSQQLPDIEWYVENKMKY